AGRADVLGDRLSGVRVRRVARLASRALRHRVVTLLSSTGPTVPGGSALACLAAPVVGILFRHPPSLISRGCDSSSHEGTPQEPTSSGFTPPEAPKQPRS